MNAFTKLLIFCVHCIIIQLSSGRNTYNYVSYEENSPLLDETKFPEKKIFTHPKSSLSSERFKTSNPYLMNDESKEFQPQSSTNESNFVPEFDSTTYKTLEMQVNGHLVKVSSKKETKNLESAPKGGGYDISVNPKYSHIIEIIHRGDNLEKSDKLIQVQDDTKEKQALELTQTPTFENTGSKNTKISEEHENLGPEDFEVDDEGDPEEFEVDDEGDPEEFERDDEGDLEGSEVELEGDLEEDEDDLEEFEVDDGDPEEDEDDPEEYDADLEDPEKFNEIKNPEKYKPVKNPHDFLFSTEEFVEKNSSVKQTVNEQTNNKGESIFEEFEGSGEVSSEIRDRNAIKLGRILPMFSRQNETLPTCTTQKGETGRCRRLGECLLSEALNNFNGFLQQLCLIRGALVGICCPDNPVIEIVNTDENSTTELKSEEIKQPPEGCGLNTKTRIVGGSISLPHEWTWMVALMRRNRFYCGGVIINNWYILTAAHCVMGMNVKDLSVRLGEYDFNESSKHTEDISISEIKRHAQFVTLTFQHDIALLKLKRSIKYSKFVGSICLPEQKSRDYSDVKGTVVGWGTVSFGGAASPILRQVTVPVWKNEECDKTYLLERIGDSFMCAGSPEKGEDACQGDSGGPLMAVNESGRWEVIGLVSWGRRCGDPTYPGVYTRVTTYLDWIKQNAV